MTQAQALVPRFLGPAGGRHFTLQFRASGAARGHVLYIPPFGEEMNRCRALAAGQARALAALGYHCTLIDFAGTGDSECELPEVTLEQWLENIRTTIAQLQDEEPLPLTVWGLRLGATIAFEFSVREELELERLLLWQPVTSGKRFVSQLLRQRVASLVNSGLASETTTEIRQRIAAGESVEVSGYFLAEALVAGIEGIGIAAAAGERRLAIDWMENVEDPADGSPTAAAKAMSKLRDAGHSVEMGLFCGPPLWQLHKRDELPELIAATNALFR